MPFLETILISIEALFANKLRSALTMLGVIIGIAAVIAMMALGEGAQQSVSQRLASLGTNVLSIRPGQARGGAVRAQATLTLDDAVALRDADPPVGLVSPEMESRIQVEYGGRNASLSVIGVWDTYFEVNTFKLAAGRLLNDSDEEARRRVAVVGALAGAQLGLSSDQLLGETVKIKGVSFEVVGVLAERGGSGFSNPDEGLFIPLATARYRVVGTDSIRTISVQAPSAEALQSSMLAIDSVLRREHRLRPGTDPDFNIRDNTSMLETMQETTNTFSFLLAGIAAISLLVGGIGVMNIMLVAVTERVREIGLRKALGATARAVRRQFLVEAGVLGAVGGLVGVGVGVGGAFLLPGLIDQPVSVSPLATVAAIGVALVIGIGFGVYPAGRAARLTPIDALRGE